MVNGKSLRLTHDHQPFTIHDSRFTIHDSRFTIYRFDQSTRTPAFFTTGAHFAISERMSSPNFSGGPPTGSKPNSIMRLLMSGIVMILFRSELRRRMMSGGVPAGASTPFHDVTSYPGTPDSATVGRLGRKSERLPLV